MSGELAQRAGRVTLLLMDADGVLTDGRIAIAPDGREWKSFDARDGLGVRLAQRAGLQLGVVSGRSSRAVAKRASELDFVEIHQGVSDKLGLVEQIRRRHGLEWTQLGFIGDDLVDVPVLRRAGLACSVPDAPPEVRGMAHHVTRRHGGRGALREVVQLLLEARGVWQDVLRRYEVEV